MAMVVQKVCINRLLNRQVSCLHVNRNFEIGLYHRNRNFEVCLHHRNRNFEVCLYHRNRNFEVGLYHRNRNFEVCQYHRNRNFEVGLYHRNRNFEICLYHRNRNFEVGLYHRDRCRLSQSELNFDPWASKRLPCVLHVGLTCGTSARFFTQQMLCPNMVIRNIRLYLGKRCPYLIKIQPASVRSSSISNASVEIFNVPANSVL